ncbi:LysM peptidoglycan-binding domain-containing protein [Candidatus Peregrinibacteria bacterium]|nr:LysM peptidoglycan-binding domain-containing protein [Candidatus Peregrinibacteria bacterium]
MADQKIEGKNWYKEVKSPKDSVPYSERLDFYLKRAAIKTDLQSLSSDFDATISGQILDGKFKSLDDLKSLAKFEKNLKSGDTIYKILLEYFSKICAPDQAKKETYLSLAYLMKSNSGANVDKLYAGGTAVIESGKITVANKAGATSLKDAFLRPPVQAEPTSAPTPVPVEVKPKTEEPTVGSESKSEGPKAAPEPTPVESGSKNEGPKVELEPELTPVGAASKNEGPKYEPEPVPTPVEGGSKNEGPKVAIESVSPPTPEPVGQKVESAPEPTPVESKSKNEGPRYEPAPEPVKVESKAKDEGPKAVIEPPPPPTLVPVEVKPKTEEPKIAPESVKPEVTRETEEIVNERIDAAEKSLVLAYVAIKTQIAPKLKIAAEKSGASYEIKSGYKDMQKLIGNEFANNDYLPLMIKESRLDPRAVGGGGRGYFQIEPIAEQEIENFYGYKASDVLNPVENCVLGILTLHRARNVYAEKDAFKSLSKDDKDFLAYAIYNKGYGNLSKLFEITGAQSYEDLEMALSNALTNALEPSLNNMKRDTALDAAYNVSYVEYPGVKAYLNHLSEETLQRHLVLNGKDTGLTLEQAGIVLRYPRLIMGIRQSFEEKVPEQIPEQTAEFKYVDYQIKAGDTLWSLSREYGLSVNFIRHINNLGGEVLSLGQKIRVPAKESYAPVEPYFFKGAEKPWITVTPGKGFYSSLVLNEKYNEYLKEITLDKSSIQEVIIDFNRRYNPELNNLRDDGNNIPLGAQIWIPNTEFFIVYYNGSLDVPRLKTEPQPELVLPPPPDVPLPPEFKGEIPPALDKSTVGQYVEEYRKSWSRDTELMKKGSERFRSVEWKNHPKWDESDKKEIIRKLGSEVLKLRDVKFIVLHSTQSTSSNNTIEGHKAHFVIDRDGTIKYLVPMDKDTASDKKLAPHAGRSAWNGTYDLNLHSIGIEVVAKEGENYSAEEFASLRKLIEFIGGYYGLHKRDVLLHKMVAYSQFGRGRKSDPNDVPSVLYAKLGLPDNSMELDMEVAKGDILSNITLIAGGKDNHVHGAWDGLTAANAIKSTKLKDALPKENKADLVKWKNDIEKQASIVKYTVKRGDTLYDIAKHYGTTPDIIKVYNSLKSSTIRPGQSIEVPKSAR